MVAAGALTIYLLTLNRWVSLSNMIYAARATGSLWTPELSGPFFYLVTYPFRWLPEKWVPLALNMFSMGCAVVVLALLARSVALLPHDRTYDQRQREQNAFSLLSVRNAWIPPVLAAFVCGLQLTFWESATAATNDMFDLLLFAYVVRCLLEYRVDGRESWLTRAALVYGASMANNWAMIGFFPAFLAALVWIKGFHFFNLRFLGRMSLCGLAGLSLYLLLPLIQVLSHGPISFWQMLKFNLAGQKNVLASFPRYTVLLLSLTSLLPVFVISIRWASYFGDNSRLGIILATWMFHLVHGLMLAVCIWVAFDPPFSPRHLGYGIPFLTFYYLGALSVGYLSGYFLLVFNPVSRHPPVLEKTIDTAATAIVWLLVFCVPAGLIYINLPSIHFTNGAALRQYASLLTQGLPKSGVVVLADDPHKLFLAEAALVQEGKADNYFFLDTRSLKWPDYHRFLQKKYGKKWPDLGQANRIGPFDDPSLINLIAQLSQTNSIYYLHSSLGYYFELFYLQPHGLVYELKRYTTNSVAEPPLTAAEIAENEGFWKKANEEVLAPLLPEITPPAPDQETGFREWFMKKLSIPYEPNATATVLAGFYSRELDYWGVRMQKAGRWDEAAGHFARAQELKPDNVIAEINFKFNKNMRLGQHTAVQVSRSMEDRFGKYRDWQQVVGDNGPFDEPSFCFAQGRVFARGGLYRQAIQEFERVTALAPENLAARIWLARLYITSQLPDRALPIIDEVRTRSEAVADDARINPFDLLYLDATAHFANHEPQKAEKLLEDAIEKSPRDAFLLAMASQLTTTYGRYSNALAVVEKQLQLQPDDLVALVNKGYLNLQLGAYEQAIPPLTQALSLQSTNYSARLNRAIAYLRSDKISEAQQDYEALQKIDPNGFRIYYGLGEIAFRKKDTNAAVRYYELYLTNSVPNSDEAKFVSERLKQLESGSH
jgi:tetratricopeptide (TPR) repeat protein